MYRHFVTIGSSEVEVFPLNFLSTQLVDEKERDQTFYRRKFSGTLTFLNNRNADDFELFYMVEIVNPCDDILYEIRQKDSGASTYHVYWNGHFSTTDGRFDLDQCNFTITPQPYDDYKNIIENGDIQYNILSIATEVTTHTYTVNYTHNRWMVDVIEYLADKMIPGVTVTSWFLNNANSPVIGGVNEYRYLTIAQKSDIKRPSSTNPATQALLSFNELMAILNGMYNLFWTYDGTTIRIEHYDYWESTAGLDLRTQKLSEKSNKYSYAKDEMPRWEKFSFMEAEDSNFTPHVISYDYTTKSPCVNNDSTERAVNVTTDLSYIEKCVADVASEELLSNIEDEGFVILANYKEGANYYVYYGTAYENGNGSFNYVNSWSYLLRAFFLHGRVLMSGYINATAVDFISARKIKQQEIKAVVCYEDSYSPGDYITTELGEAWFGGQKGYVKTASIKPSGEVTFNLLYGEDKDTSVVMPTRAKTLHVVIDDAYANIYSYLSEPNIYDTYYWILWNDGDASEECQEIMIPAGTVYQNDGSTFVGAFISVEFNVSDASLDTWHFVYNDNDVWDECFDIDCGGAAPPAVPAAPVAIGVSQSGICEPSDFSWNTSAGATYYQVYRKPNLSGENLYEFISNETGTHYYDYPAGIDDFVTYYYKVKACNISGCSADSNEVSILIQC